MRMVRADGRRLCLVRTSDGVFALDHACPHEGYGLTQGTLDGNLLTCAWHNWKFRVDDGTCVLGEEDVRTHPVTVDADGSLHVTLREPDPAALRPVLLASLRRGIERDYVGQVSRDVVRLLRADANPGELVWEAVAYGAPRGEFGWGHSVASATDCLAMVDLYEGDQRALPIVQAIAGIAETERDRPVVVLPDPTTRLGTDPGGEFRRLVEAERLAPAQALVRGAIHDGWSADELRPWFTAAVSDHLLSYGHAAIYTQKAFQLLDVLGWERADTVLPHLVPTIVYGTREDTLPYMRPFTKALAGVDLRALASLDPDPTWRDDGALRAAILGGGRDRAAVLHAAVDALREGAGVDGVLDVVVDCRRRADAALRPDRRVRLPRRFRLARHHPRDHLRQRRAMARRLVRAATTRGRRPAGAVVRVPRPLDRSPRVAHGDRRARRGRPRHVRRRRRRSKRCSDERSTTRRRRSSSTPTP